MDWWNFKDLTFLVFFIFVVTVLVLLLFFIISFSINQYLNGSYTKKVKEESNSTRIYTINLKKNTVSFFNRSNMREKRNMDLMGFYSHFHPNDVEKLKNWILAISIDPKEVEQYLEVDVLLNKGKTPYYSLLKLLKYNREQGLIHLESHLLRFITPNNSVAKKKNKKSVPIGMVKRSIIENMVSHNRSLRGFTFAIRFFYIRQKVLSNDKIEKYMVVTLKNEIYPFASNNKLPRQMLDTAENEVLLFDLRIGSRDEAMSLATSIEHALNKSVEVNGFSGSVDFAIGIIENAQYYQDFDSIVTKAQEACMSAQQNNQHVLIYQKTVNQMLELNKYSEEVDNLMRPGNLRFLFRPIIDVTRKRILGYFQYVKGYNTPFTSFSEMSKYAAKSGKNRELFSRVAKSVIPKFDNEKSSDSWRLFFNASLVDIDHMVELLPQINTNPKLKIVLLFEEKEINENGNQLELIDGMMKKFHSMKYEIALLMKDRNLLLAPEFYNNFDYFVAGASMIGEIRKDNRIRLSIHTLIEQLLKYKKPIVATDLDSWQAIELIIKSGITIVSSDIISPSNDMLLPIEKKKMEKLVTMDDNFH
ncbi:MAG: hypothetical protein K6C32_04545 [Bacilli bacterium]|nr:hypothetical protein [Bacilli bacterium]